MERRTHVITIPGELPGLNEVIAMSKSHYGRYSQSKRRHTETVAWLAKQLPAMERADIAIHWHCKSKRRDKDNIATGAKYVLDGLVMAGVIRTDGWKHIGGITHTFSVDKANPRIEVELREVGHATSQPVDR